MTRMTYGQLAPLTVEELIAAANAELETYRHDGDRDHLYNAGRAATWAGNRAPKPPRQPKEKP